MSESVINDPLRLNSIAKIAGIVTDITGEEAFFDYFIPGNATKTKDDTFIATVTVGTDGEFFYNISQDILNLSGMWRFQPSFTKDGNTYHEQNTTCHTVLEKGGACQ